MVHGEVGGCDVAARRGQELVLIEIKLVINLELLLQVARRREASRSVYAAVMAPKAVNKRWRELTRLLKFLEAGLILVFPHSPGGRVEVAFHPETRDHRPRRKVTRALLAEMDGRSRDLNQGGSTRRPIMTAYREEALGAAEALDRLGPSRPRDLRRAGAGGRTGAILRDNHYGWFERIAYGLYGLNEAGRLALGAYREQIGRTEILTPCGTADIISDCD
jgi:hypothetical protein